MAVVGEGIEAQVQLLEPLEIPASRRSGDEIEALGGDAPLREERADRVLVTAARGLQDQSRAGQGLKDRHPELKGRPGDLGELIQTAEGDEPVAQGRQCG